MVKNDVNDSKMIHKSKFHPVIQKKSLTLGQRSADKLTYYAGSWRFIIGLLVFIAIWMVLNISLLRGF